MLVGGAGAYNYHRNAQLDADFQFRPYKGLSDSELEVLIAAYDEEIETLGRHRERFQDPSEKLDRVSSYIADRIEAFEESQQRNESWKKLRRSMMERQVAVEEIRTEQEIRRSGVDKEWRRILRRVTTL